MSCHHLRQRADERAFRQGHLECVVMVWSRCRERGISRRAESLNSRGLADEQMLSLMRAPGFRGDAAEADARIADRPAVQVDGDGRGREGEGVARAVANLEIHRTP